MLVLEFRKCSLNNIKGIANDSGRNGCRVLPWRKGIDVFVNRETLQLRKPCRRLYKKRVKKKICVGNSLEVGESRISFEISDVVGRLERMNN